jgi:hypothetical protein
MFHACVKDSMWRGIWKILQNFLGTKQGLSQLDREREEAQKWSHILTQITVEFVTSIRLSSSCRHHFPCARKKGLCGGYRGASKARMTPHPSAHPHPAAATLGPKHSQAAPTAAAMEPARRARTTAEERSVGACAVRGSPASAVCNGVLRHQHVSTTGSDCKLWCHKTICFVCS